MSTSHTACHAAFLRLRQSLEAAVLGQPALIERLLLALLADGHLLVEGPPGVAKTRAVRALAGLIDGDFHRLQFTPDLLPADLTGTEVFRPQDGSFRFEPGPVFHSLLLADEINRAPAKVQSALLEAMAERQVTVGHCSYPLPELFLVMATQNPLEHEGVFPLPEAQLDRFLMHVRVGCPEAADERRIVELAVAEAKAGAAAAAAIGDAVMRVADILAARREVLDVHIADPVSDYIVALVAATRAPERWLGEAAGDGGRWVDYGASPRASIALARATRALAWLDGRDFVTPTDVQTLAPDVLRHRVGLCYARQVAGQTVDRLVAELIARLPAP